jgi:hypothetical protein
MSTCNRCGFELPLLKVSEAPEFISAEHTFEECAILLLRHIAENTDYLISGPMGGRRYE